MGLLTNSHVTALKDHVARDELSNWGTDALTQHVRMKNQDPYFWKVLRAQTTQLRVYSDTPLRYAPGSVISMYPYPCIPVSISTVSKYHHPRGRYV
ncbi:hypothetical protein Pyn_36825 [Prunus yedoensis var. nudiflora]|uniref:Uncharacterized protein n=1 Tax=Prunus yedoensis var. nudiflora TaxID=2094558 RepID=A0A314ZQX1_PRUYE|nr:hypothetical protein Pyn_36825 [Prunus yedoensis var. nudiflora]